MPCMLLFCLNVNYVEGTISILGGKERITEVMFVRPLGMAQNEILFYKYI